MNRETRQIHHRACSLCEAMCGLVITVNDGRIRSIRGDRADVFSRGHICPKAVALQDIQDDPDRLRRPLRRNRQGGWSEVDWRSALDEAGDRIRTLQRAHGRDSMAVYLGNPSAHNYATLLFGPPLIRSLRTRNRYSATSVDQLPHHLAASLMFGHQLLLPIPDIDRTQFLFVLGANPVVSNGSLMTAPGAKRRLKDLVSRGGRLVVVDPRRTETAELADHHLPIRPESDVLLLLALLHVVFEEDLERLDRLGDVVVGLETVRRSVVGVTPERVTEATGIDAGAIRTLARDFAAAESAVCYGRLGVSTQRFGGLCQWLINVLNIVTGNLDRPGGVMFTRPAVDLLARSGRGSFGRWRSRVRSLPSFGGELPVAALAEEIQTTGAGQVRGLLTVAGNPVLSTPNGRQLDRALAELEFMVCVDFYLNETTRHADLILPPTPPLERDHYDLVFHALAVRNTVRYSPPLFQPAGDARHDWQILDELRHRVDTGPIRGRAGRWLATRLGPRRLLDIGIRSGPYGAGFRPFAGGLSLAKVAAEDHGIDLGALRPCLPEALRTDDRRIELAPDELVADLPRALAVLDETANASAGSHRLVLIGRRHLRSNNSWMHNYRRLMGGRARCTLLINPIDAEKLDLTDGQLVVVSSRVGRVEAPIEFSDEMRPGVVSLPHGWGHHREGIRLNVARQHPGVSVNDLTDDREIDVLIGTAAFSGVPVRVEPASGA